jgi:uncharacterized protein (TIGR02597 family)
MRKKLFIFGALALVSSQAAVFAASSVAVTTRAHGMMTFTAAASATTYLSLPLAQDPIYTGKVGSVQSSGITLSAPASQLAGNLAAAGSPYFVKFLTGNETGRTLLVTANTSSSLTMDVTDGGSVSVSLQTSGFAVNAGDSFEVFGGYTLSSVFGANTAQNPLPLTGGASFGAADWVFLFNPTTSSWQIYFFNTSLNYWVLEGTTSNANSAVLYPYSSVAISRRGATPVSLTLSGSVSGVASLIKATGSNAVTYASTGYAVGTTLAQLKFGSNWVTGSTASTADQISIWNNASKAFVSYYQLSDSTWRAVSNATVNVSSVAVPAGTCISIVQHATAAGSSLFLSPALPYTASN